MTVFETLDTLDLLEYVAKLDDVEDALRLVLETTLEDVLDKDRDVDEGLAAAAEMVMVTVDAAVVEVDVLVVEEVEVSEEDAELGLAHGVSASTDAGSDVPVISLAEQAA